MRFFFTVTGMKGNRWSLATIRVGKNGFDLLNGESMGGSDKCVYHMHVVGKLTF